MVIYLKKLVSLLCVVALALSVGITANAEETFYYNRILSVLNQGFTMENVTYTLPNSSMKEYQAYLSKHRYNNAQTDKIITAINSAECMIGGSVKKTGTNLKNLPSAAKKGILKLMLNAAPDGQLFTSDGNYVTVIEKDGSTTKFTIPDLDFRMSRNAVLLDTGYTLSVKKGATYQFKAVADRKPTFICGTPSAFKVTYAGSKGRSYYFKVTAVGKVGDGAGFYVNNEILPRTIGTIVQ